MKFHADLVNKAVGAKAAQVAFAVNLPFLEGVSISDLLKLRADEHEYFRRFQIALRTCINERVRAAQHANAADVAKQVTEDVLEPAVLKIIERLRAAETLVKKKTATGIFLGSVTTVCGLLLGLPPTVSVPAGIAPIVTMTGQASMKYLEEKRDVELEDMYFLWKASEQHHHH